MDDILSGGGYNLLEAAVKKAREKKPVKRGLKIFTDSTSKKETSTPEKPKELQPVFIKAVKPVKKTDWIKTATIAAAFLLLIYLLTKIKK